MRQSSRPMGVNIVGDARKRGKPCVDVLEDIGLALYRASRLRRQLIATVCAPALDHLARHLDVALEADMPAERKCLLGIEGVGQDARGALRQTEGVVMPLESPEQVPTTEPRIR